MKTATQNQDPTTAIQIQHQMTDRGATRTTSDPEPGQLQGEVITLGTKIV